MHKALVFIAILFMLAGCTNPPPAGTGGAQIPTAQQTPHPSYSTIDITSVAGLYDSELSKFFPDELSVPLYGTNVTLVPVRANPYSFENEFPILDAVFAPEAINDIGSKESYVYMETTSPSSIWVEFSVYKFKNPETARKVIDLYRTQWNQIELSYGNGSVWIWEGWKEQVAQGRVPDRYLTGAFCSWDPNTEFLVFGDQGVTDQILTSPKTDLFCLHGEQARGEYFFMIDVHASPAIIDTVGEASYSQIIPHIYNVSVNETQTPNIPTGGITGGITGNATSGNVTEGGSAVIIISEKQQKIRDIEDQMIELTRKYTDGEITYEEFNRLFTILDGRLTELEGA